MPVDRPTFSESWYRVAHLRPRLRSTVQTFRQTYRGQTWHVVRDPTNNQFFRLHEAAYHFVALLDGHRTVSHVWDICNKTLGDQAPTQGEAIQLLGQLYASNLLWSDMPADAAGLFKRYKQRVQREVSGYLMNLLAARIPIFDPDRMLDRWVGALGWVFSPVGFVLWLAVIAAGLYTLIGSWPELFKASNSVLDPSNLALLYLGFAMIKAIHEFGHGLACKRFGRLDGTGGEVHTVGIMFLVLMPVPYVDASSSWAFRSKWRRAMVGLAGMYVELAVAAVMALVWARTSPGTTIHALAYNIMFIASVSTILFNANPLLRFDGYYILSDLIEIPNLAQRSKDYVNYLVKKYAFGVRRPQNPAHAPRERYWLFVYAIASTVYRVFITITILIFIGDQLFKIPQFFLLGMVFLLSGLIGWLLMPVFKFFRYLLTSPELIRTRQRAMGVTAATLVVLFVLIGVIPMPDRHRAEGVVEPRNLAIIHAAFDGFIDEFQPSGVTVAPDDAQPMVRVVNRELLTARDQLMVEERLVDAQWAIAAIDDVARAAVLREKLDEVRAQLTRVEDELSRTAPRAPFRGTWVSPGIDHAKGRFVKRGEQLGLVAGLDDPIIRVVADQRRDPDDLENAPALTLRVKGRPQALLDARITRVHYAGQDRLPSAALGYQAGGSVQVAMDDREGTKAAEQFFQLLIEPTGESKPRELLPGQRVIVRFELPAKPLGLQWWLMARQLIQRRFQQ